MNGFLWRSNYNFCPGRYDVHVVHRSATPFVVTGVTVKKPLKNVLLEWDYVGVTLDCDECFPKNIPLSTLLSGTGLYLGPCKYIRLSIWRRDASNRSRGAVTLIGNLVLL
jgi:hypothetical protein